MYVNLEIPVVLLLDSIPTSQELFYVVGEKSEWLVERTWPRLLRGEYVIRPKMSPIVTCCALL